MGTSVLRLKKNQERRLLAGHCWVYSNEVDTEATPLRGFEPGQQVLILSHQGRPLGQGYVNPHSLICARLLSRSTTRPLSLSLWIERIRRALELRDRIYAQPFYRLIFSESDGLPGLVVDRYGELLTVQIATAGMERLKGDMIAALEQVVRPKTIILRNDIQVRELEGLTKKVETILGEPTVDLELLENNTRFLVPVLGGQKTGWFYDQGENRSRVLRLGKPARVLDLCSYIGAWGVEAAVAGAGKVVCVDSSLAAVERVGENAARNRVVSQVSAIQGDAFDVLRALRESRERFDLVILDPPAFMKRRKDEKAGAQAYLRLNRLGLDLVEPGGLLATSSCSFHMGSELFVRIVQQAAQRSRVGLQLLQLGGQGPDHPIHPAIAETNYLKTCFVRVLPQF
jgi:23S rRNA (cytosine1962-C5)-methyltransferase